VTRQILPDNREILFSYDANGNLASLLPPGSPGHSFTYTYTYTYTPVNLTESSVPPDLGAGSNYPVPLQSRQTADPNTASGRPDGRLQLRQRRTHRQRHRSRRQLQL